MWNQKWAGLTRVGARDPQEWPCREEGGRGGLSVYLSLQPWGIRFLLSNPLDANVLVPFFSFKFAQAWRIMKKRRENSDYLVPSALTFLAEFTIFKLNISQLKFLCPEVILVVTQIQVKFLKRGPHKTRESVHSFAGRNTTGCIVDFIPDILATKSIRWYDIISGRTDEKQWHLVANDKYLMLAGLRYTFLHSSIRD